MGTMATRNVFDELNDALSAQITKLQSIDPKDKDSLELCIGQSKAVAALAGNINKNTRNAIECVKLHQEIAEATGKNLVMVPRLLESGDDA